MKRSSIVWIIIAGCLTVAGIIIFIVAMSLNGWKFSSFDNETFVTEKVGIDGDFRNISVYADTEDIDFAPSSDGKCSVVFTVKESMFHDAFIENNTLVVETHITKKWYENISFFSYGNSKITVYLPQSSYSDLTIEESTGDVDLPADFSFDNVYITVSTGRIKCNASSKGVISIDLTTGDTVLSDVTCSDLNSRGSTGDVLLTNVTAGRIDIERSTGDIKFDMCDAADLLIHTSTGDVTGTLRSGKVFIAETSTGDIKIPESSGEGRCEITTSTGDINIEVR